MLQANSVVKALKGKTKPVVAELWGGQTDANAFLFKSGNDAVLNPLFTSGKLVKGPQQFVDGWLATNAATDFQQFLVKTNNKIDGVIAANDNIAGAVVATLKAKGLPKIALSGQDAIGAGRAERHLGLADDDRLQEGPLEAQVAAKAAVQLLKGQKVTGINAWCDGKKNLCTAKKSKAEPSILLVPITITKANYKILFADKFLKRGEVCVGAVQEVLPVGRRRNHGGGVRMGASTGFVVGNPPRDRYAPPRAPRHHQDVRLGRGAVRRRPRGAPR